MTRPATSSEAGVGKAPRHEIAGEEGSGDAAGSMGIWPRRQVGRGWIELPAAIALLRGTGVSDGRNERSGHCRAGLAVRLQRDLTTGRKRGLGGPRSQPEW
jgi:hypothetical protein